MAPCNPPLNFVQNGPAGSAFPPPLDPSDVPTVDSNPGFGDLASSLLDALDPATDGSDQISSDAAAAVDTLDTIGTGMDATLDTILLLLDQAQPQPVDDALGTLAGDQPGAESFVGDVQGVSVPAIGTVPILAPDGLPVVTVGAPPAQGGEPAAGGAAYVLHVPIVFAFNPNQLVGGAILTGPNPPFVKLNGFAPNGGARGTGGWDALVEINPAAAGTFSATLKYSLAVTFTGINTIVHYTIPVLVVVQ